MEYRVYVQWCEQNRLPAMDYAQWECGWFMRGMDERREEKKSLTRTDANKGQEQKEVKQ